MSREKSGKYLLFAGALVFWIFVWQAAAYAVNRQLLIPVPTPAGTLKALLGLMRQPDFYRSVLSTIVRVASGFAAAFLLGTVLAVLTSGSAVFRTIMAPLLSVIRAIPVASFTILVFLWVERERIPSVISFFTVLPMIWATIENGLSEADSGLIEMAKVFGMPGRRILTEIILPGIRPFFSAAVMNGIGFAWKSGVAAEVICRTRNSIGDLLWAGKSSVSYDEVFAVTLVIVILSAVLEGAAKQVMKADAGIYGGKKQKARAF